MTAAADGLTPSPPGYAAWLADLKRRIQDAQLRASLAVNAELVQLYWQIGRDILERQAKQGWGSLAAASRPLPCKQGSAGAIGRWHLLRR